MKHLQQDGIVPGHEPYLSRQLIAYIGNKRLLLPFLGNIFKDLVEPDPRRRIIDPFSGSGSVSRLAKSLGYSVAANDWEPYAKIVTEAHLSINKHDVSELFQGRIGEVFDQFNRLKETKERYIADYYAPAVTEEADYRRERLFYTRENGLFIDVVRYEIEKRYPGWDLGRKDYQEKLLLVSSLLYEAATHANTNGVFKAFHKGFGGHGKDALQRILAPMVLEVPCLIDGPGSYDVSSVDAAVFVKRQSGDICYLDPPYNSHQYGSNYHLLNTIALWDKPAVDLELTKDGRLKEKGGIRKDWVDRKSRWCYASTAPDALKDLLASVDARYIVLSYNTEGIIPFEELYEILSSEGKTELYVRDYTKYRGGKQSIRRKTRNLEFQLVIKRGKRPGKTDRQEMLRFLKVRKMLSIMKGGFVPERMQSRFKVLNTGEFDFGEGPRGVIGANGANGISDLHWRGGDISFAMRDFYRIETEPDNNFFDALMDDDLDRFEEDLLFCACTDRQEEVGVLITLLQNGLLNKSPGIHEKQIRKYQKQLLRIIRKFAFRKYRKEFEETMSVLEDLGKRYPRFRELTPELDEIRRVAELRLHG